MVSGGVARCGRDRSLREVLEKFLELNETNSRVKASSEFV